MASKTKHTETVRKRKSAPNRDNLKVEQKRLRNNMEVLDRVLREA